MSSPQMVKADAAPTAATVDLKLEVVVLPVADVNRSRRFYEGLGWRLRSTSSAVRTSAPSR